MLPKQDLSWWYWLSTIPFITIGILGEINGLLITAAIIMIQLAHFYVLENFRLGFAVQVRLGFLGWFSLAQLPCMEWMLWAQLIGTSISVLFDYCAMARMLALAPWNRTQPLNRRLVMRAFFSRPVRGSILEASVATQK